MTPPAAPPPPRPQAALKPPLATMFGPVVDGTHTRQSRIALEEDGVYGWRIKLPCTGPTWFRETLQLSSARDWQLDPEAKHVAVSPDRRRAVTEDYSGCYDGWLQHTWTIGADDPPAEYVLTVEIEGYRPQRFRGRFVRAAEDGDGD